MIRYDTQYRKIKNRFTNHNTIHDLTTMALTMKSKIRTIVRRKKKIKEIERKDKREKTKIFYISCINELYFVLTIYSRRLQSISQID